MKKILIALIALFGWISAVSAENFYIENYDVILKVDNYNNIDIEENIDVNFTHPSHGIFRNIPYINNVVRADGRSYKTRAIISNIRTSEHSSITEENGNYVIRMGDKDKLIRGKKSYLLKYLYALNGPDDELYFNIIGTDWDTDINKVTFKIYMPKEFPSENVGLSIGKYGTKGFSEGAVFKVNRSDNTIEGYTTQALNPHEALTVRAQLPKGYFIKKPDYARPICYFLIILFTFISFIYWFVFGKDKEAIPVVNFYPPKDFNSALVGLIYKEKADIKQVVSLVIYLADKGYIRIEDDGISQTFHKLKDYDGQNLECKELMDALFKYGRNSISSIELETSPVFYRDCAEIVSHLNIAKNVIYEKDSVKLSTKLPVILSILALFAILCAAFSNFNLNTNIIGVMTFVLMFFASAILIMTRFFVEHNSFWEKTQLLLFALMFGMPALLVGAFYASFSFYLDIAVCSMISLIISGVCFYHLPKKNNQGLAILGHILGYKKFLETAQKHELEKLINDNPKYYFNMIPFAYVLGVSDVWIKKFEGIINNKPDWYSGHFGPCAFANLTDNLCTLSSPSVSNGGISTSSSGGGGSSGGGSGGGGGGSW